MADLSIIRTLLKDRGIKVKDFCEDLGLTEQGFAKLIRANSTKIETLELIANKLNVPIATFFEEAHDADSPHEELNPLEEPNFMHIPVVPIYAQAGFLKGFGDGKYMESLPTMPVVTDRNFKGNYMIFEVRGDSMDDGSSRSLVSGDKLMAREVRQEYWHSTLHYRSWFFVIVHRTEGILVKQIVSHDVETGVIICHSLNPLFEDFKINLADVAQLYNVVQIVAREMRL